MELNEFTVRLIFLGLPGIIVYYISDKLVIRKNKDSLLTILAIFLYSVISYVFLALCTFLFGDSESNTIISQIFYGNENVSIATIFGGISFGISLSLLAGLQFRFNLINKLAQLIGATKRFGDTDVWHFFNNSPMDNKNDGYIYIRDHKVDLVYYGYISLYSDSNEERELVLTDVTVYENKSGAECYSLAHMYL
jgi:hypothetical protein